MIFRSYSAQCTASKPSAAYRRSVGHVRARDPAALRACAAPPAHPSTSTLPESVRELTEPDVPTFDDLGVDLRLTVSLPDNGVQHPSEIQEKAIPEILKGSSVAIQSFTGSGKNALSALAMDSSAVQTLAFLLPIMTMAIKRLEGRVNGEPSETGPEALIIAPSRELAMQTVRVAQSLLPQEAWPLVQNAIGGANMRRQLDSIKSNGPLLIVGTPGRMAELSRLGALRTHRTAAVVLDEVDQLLCQQFRDDLIRIVSHAGSRLPAGPQLVSASATMTPELVARLKALLRTSDDIPILTPFDGQALPAAETHEVAHVRQEPNDNAAAPSTLAKAPAWGWGQGSGFWAGRAGAASSRGTAGGVAQGRIVAGLPGQLEHAFVVEVKRHHVDAVRRVVHALDARRVLVFMNHQDRLVDAMHKLAQRGLSVGSLHGEMPKQARAAVLSGFRAARFRVLLVSDVAARGLDVADCDAVINLELPSSAAHYVHRAGRTGRMGRDGVVISIVEKQYEFVIDKIAAALELPVRQCKVSGGRASVIADGAVRVLGRFKEKEEAKAAAIAAPNGVSLAQRAIDAPSAAAVQPAPGT